MERVRRTNKQLDGRTKNQKSNIQTERLQFNQGKDYKVKRCAKKNIILYFFFKHKKIKELMID